MKDISRRDLLNSMALAAGAFGVLAPGRAFADQALEPLVPDTEVKRVLVMFKCHFDAGFIDTQANVVSWYFEQVFPQGDPNRCRPPAGGERSLYLDHRLLADLPIP